MSLPKPVWTKQKDGSWIAENIEVFRTGTWNGWKFTDQDIDDLYNDSVESIGQLKPPVKLDHEQSKKLPLLATAALGWVKNFTTQTSNVGRHIFANLYGVPDTLATIVQKGMYKRNSVEVIAGWRSGLTKKVYPKVIKAVSFSGAELPAVNTMEDMVAFHEGRELIAFENSSNGMVMSFNIDPVSEKESGDQTVVVIHRHEGDGKGPNKTKGREGRMEVDEKAYKELQAFQEKYGPAVETLEQADKIKKGLEARQEADKEKKIDLVFSQLVKEGKVKPEIEKRWKLEAGACDDVKILEFVENGNEVKKTLLDMFLERELGRDPVLSFSQTSGSSRNEKKGQNKGEETPIWEDQEEVKKDPAGTLWAFAEHIHKTEKEAFPNMEVAFVEAGARLPELAELHVFTQNMKTKVDHYAG